MIQTKKGPWKEREFVDLWSLVHFLGSFAIGGAFVFFHITPYIAGAIAVGIFGGWEIFELLAKIHEQSANRVSDVLVDYAGFFLAQLYVFAWHGTMYWYIPAGAACVAVGMEMWGILDFKNRKG